VCAEALRALRELPAHQLPTRPLAGELALASARCGNRPARKALRPARQAWFIASAIRAGWSPEERARREAGIRPRVEVRSYEYNGVFCRFSGVAE